MEETDNVSNQLTDQELRAKLGSLSDTDLLRLQKIASRLCGGTDYGPDDLLQTAFERTLSGERTCPKDLDMLVFISNVMRSLAWARREAMKIDPLWRQEDITAPGGVSATLADKARSPEEHLISMRDHKAREQALLDVFGDDPQALLVLMGILDEETPEEICKLGGFTLTTYNSIRRRIRRTMEKAFPKGWIS